MISLFSIHGSENLFLGVQSVHKVYIIGVVYRHPSCIATDLEYFESLLESTIDHLNSRRHTFYLAGDFNLNLFNYDSDNKIKNKLT